MNNDIIELWEKLKMKIRLLGSRGGIQASGPDYNKYGGDTSCFHISDGDDYIILDAGSGLRKLSPSMLKPDNESIILLTHFHIDHIIGIPFFIPFFIKDYKFVVYGPKDTPDDVYRVINGFLHKDYFPINIENFESDISFDAFTEGKKLSHKSFDIEALWVNHPCNTLSYKIKNNGKTLVYLTDHEPYKEILHPLHKSLHKYNNDPDLLHARLVDFIKDADVLIVDGEYTPEEYYSKHVGWGHSSMNDSLKLALDGNVKKVVFHHHSQFRTDTQIDILDKDINSYIEENKLPINIMFSKADHCIDI